MVLSTEWKNKLEEWTLDAREGATDIIDKKADSLSIRKIEEIIEHYGGQIEKKENAKPCVKTQPHINEDEQIAFSIEVSVYDDKSEEDYIKRMKESLMHEFAHVYISFMINRGKFLKVTSDRETPALTEKELSANYFARAFLMPKNEFIRRVLENSFNNLCNFEEVAKIFEVRVQAVIDRGRDLALWE